MKERKKLPLTWLLRKFKSQLLFESNRHFNVIQTNTTVHLNTHPAYSTSLEIIRIRFSAITIRRTNEKILSICRLCGTVWPAKWTNNENFPAPIFKDGRHYSITSRESSLEKNFLVLFSLWLRYHHWMAVIRRTNGSQGGRHDVNRT